MTLFNHTSLRALIVMAHPDDAEIGCFGTMMALRARGYEVHLLIVGSGEHGVSIQDRAQGAGPLAPSLRLKESMAAFDKTGVKVESLLHEDGALEVTRQLISEIEAKLKSFKPALLITHHLDLTGLDHQDHQAVARAVLNASARSRSVETLLYSEPHLSRTHFNPTVFVDITRYHAQKLEALEAHQSQAGRVYLSERYHQSRGLRNAHKAGTWFMEEERCFESFELGLAVVAAAS